MPKGDTRDGIFYPTLLTLMIDSYDLQSLLLPDPVAQSSALVHVAGVQVDKLPSHRTVPLGPATTDVTNKRQQEIENT